MRPLESGFFLARKREGVLGDMGRGRYVAKGGGNETPDTKWERTTWIGN